MSDTACCVQETLSIQLHKPIQDVVGQARIVDDLGADSLDFIEIILAVEDRFDIHISDERTKTITTVSDLIQAVNDSVNPTARESFTPMVNAKVLCEDLRAKEQKLRAGGHEQMADGVLTARMLLWGKIVEVMKS